MIVWDLLFDLDDTLIPNNYKYGIASWRCGLILAEAMGVAAPRPTTIIELHSEIDVKMVKQRGLGLDRFPTSWEETYIRLCAKAGCRPQPSVRRRLRNTASRFKFGPFTAYPGTKRVLAAAKKEGHRLHLVTAGVDLLQNRKIDQAGLRRFFDSVHITQLEKGSVMRDLVGKNAAHAVMCGDSKKGDIKPAKDLGITTVWIPRDTWPLAESPVNPDHTIETITEYTSVLRKITKGKK